MSGAAVLNRRFLFEGFVELHGDRKFSDDAAVIAGLAVSAVVGAAIVGVWYLIVQQMISAQVARNAFLTTEIAKLDLQKLSRELRADLAATRSKQKAKDILGLDINGHVVRKLWIEQASDIANEYYLSITFDRGAKLLVGDALELPLDDDVADGQQAARLDAAQCGDREQCRCFHLDGEDAGGVSEGLEVEVPETHQDSPGADRDRGRRACPSRRCPPRRSSTRPRRGHLRG